MENLGTVDVVNPVMDSDEDTYRVVRGSRYNYTMTYARTTYRYGQTPDLNTTSSKGATAHGFRVMCPLTLKFPAPEVDSDGETTQGEGE